MRPFPSGWARRGLVSGLAMGFGWASVGMATAMRWKSRCPIPSSGSGSAVTTPTACSKAAEAVLGRPLRLSIQVRDEAEPPWVMWSSPGRNPTESDAAATGESSRFPYRATPRRPCPSPARRRTTPGLPRRPGRLPCRERIGRSRQNGCKVTSSVSIAAASSDGVPHRAGRRGGSMIS